MVSNRLIVRKFAQNRWVQHLSFWGFSFLVLLKYFQLSSRLEPIDYIYTCFFHVSIVTGIYINLRILIPAFLKKKRITLFTIFFLVDLFAVSQLNVFIFDFLIDKLFPGYYFISYYNFRDILLFHLIYLVLTSLLKLSKEWFGLLESKAKLAQTEQEKMQYELQALQSQVNPHFLFNSLNNIYSLSLRKADKTPEVILALSDIFRYMIYETREELIELTKEVAFLKKYIELQQIRTDPKTEITFRASGETDQVKVAPLIFLPFLENSFKHGIKGETKGGYIRLFIDVDQEHIHFNLTNNKGQVEDPEKGTSGGVGLENVRRRLELQYPQDHRLEIVDNGQEFSVSLALIKR